MSNGYVPEAILFDGTTDWMFRFGLTGISSSKLGLVNLWFRVDGGNNTQRFIFSDLNSILVLELTDQNKLTLSNPATSRLELTHDVDLQPGPNWHHYFASWDLGSAKASAYLDGVIQTTKVTVDGTINYASMSDWTVGAKNFAGQDKFPGAIADNYFATEFLDLDVETNRLRFIDSDGNPVFLGVTGELPTGTASLLYIRGKLLDQGFNSGTGGNLESKGIQVPGETPGPVVPPPEIDIGHGTSGLISDLKDFVRLAGATDSRKDTVVTLKPVKIITGWSLFQGAVHSVDTVTEYDHMRLDIVGVKTSIDSGLTRVETLQICIDTPGTFFYVADEEFEGGQVHWDNGSSWDTAQPNSPIWDQFNTLYVHLFDGTDPELQTVVAQYGIFLSNRELVISELGPDKLINGDFENWTPDYLTHAILFDGSTNFMLRGGNITGLVDGTLGILSLWFRIDGANNTERYLFGNELSRISLRLTFKNELILVARNNLGQEIIRLTHDKNLLASSQWNHYVGSWDLTVAFGTAFSFLNDVADASSLISDDTIDYTDTDWIVGAKNAAGDSKFNGGISELYFTNQFLDLELAGGVNRRRFITFEKGPVFLGVTGEIPTGTSALVYLLGDLADQGVNSGTGGDFVFQGTPRIITEPSVRIPEGPVVETADGWTSSDEELASKESTVVKFNDFALRHKVSAAEPAVNTQQQLTGFVIGQMYRFAGYYETSVNTKASISVFDGSGNFYLSDGRYTLQTTLALDLSKGNVGDRTFFFDFRAFAETLNFQLLADYTGSGTASAFVFWDGMTVERIWRFTNCDPRISARSVPTVKTGSNDIFFGGKSIGSGNIGVINSDGQIERLVADFEWMNQEVVIQSGGAFSDGQEIPFNDYRHSMTGLIQKLDVDDLEVQFDLQDIRAFFHQTLPFRVYDDVTFSEMDFSRLGFPRPIFFGVKEHIDPVRISKTTDGVTEFGTYEICDTQNSPDGIKVISKVFIYLDINDAVVKDPSKRAELTLGTHYSEDLLAGTITILVDIVPILVVTGNNTFSFNDSAGTGQDHDVEVPIGVYTPSSLAIAITNAMITSGGQPDTTCTYSPTTGLFTFTSVAILELYFAPADARNTVPSEFPKLINFKLTNRVGATSYVSDVARDVDIDRDVQFRVDAQGYKDDASGTFTGTADALIEIGSDILRTLLIQFMRKSPSVIDEGSFIFARERSAESLTVFLNETTSTKDIFDTLEFSNISNIVVNGEGKVFYNVYVGEIPANIKTLNDADIKKWSVERSVADIYAGIRVKYDKSPTTGVFKQLQADDTSVAVRLGRPEIREFDTYLKTGDNAISTANRMLELARSAARKVSATAVGGNFVDLEVGDKIKINRKRALAVGGKITNEVFRIISIGKEQQEGIVDMDLTDDRVTVANDDCITDCQQHCEGTCQETDQCTISCQQECEQPGNSQQPCDINCQEGCQRTCENCEGVCESVEENPPLCDTGCEVTCQACEGAGCQTSCESSGCEANCQDCQNDCQTGANCQNACQRGGCEDSCQNCQDSCETSSVCQTGCQLGNPCQSTCQTGGCENGCQNCQDSCQTGGCERASEDI